jgi:hypothetical protein
LVMFTYKLAYKYLASPSTLLVRVYRKSALKP